MNEKQQGRKLVDNTCRAPGKQQNSREKIAAPAQLAKADFH